MFRRYRGAILGEKIYGEKWGRVNGWKSIWNCWCTVFFVRSRVDLKWILINFEEFEWFEDFGTLNLSETKICWLKEYRNILEEKRDLINLITFFWRRYKITCLSSSDRRSTCTKSRILGNSLSMLRGVCLRAADAKDGKRAGRVLQVNYGDRMLF